MRPTCLAVALAMALHGTLHAAENPAPAMVSACFTPGLESCADLIASKIAAARSRVRVQAYYLTSLPIIRAVADAKRRGLDVGAILDRSQDRRNDVRARYSSAVYLVHARVRVHRRAGVWSTPALTPGAEALPDNIDALRTALLAERTAGAVR